MAPRHRGRRPGFDTVHQRELVWAEYQRLMHGNDHDPERAKIFGARHTALKTAIAHIEALQKIEGREPDDSHHDGIAIVAHARAALAQEKVTDEPEADD